MLEIGSASVVINNELGTEIQGAGVAKKVARIRDDLEANLLYLASDGTAILLVSCDVAGFENDVTARFRAAIAAATGLEDRSILIGATHTHGGPSLVRTHPGKQVDAAWVERCEGWLADAGRRAVESAAPGRLAWGRGMAQVGYNRRLCWADGTHTMHDDASRDDFIGLEGPCDPAHLAIFAADTDGNVTAVLHHNTSHPTVFYGDDCLSADFPGVSRGQLRAVLGPVPVLFFNGAQGDISNEDQLSPRARAETRDQKVSRLAHLVTGETLRLLHEATFHDQVPLGHDHELLEMPVRLPDPERLTEARKVLERYHAGERIVGQELIFAHGPVYLHERFADDPTDTLAIHGLRIGGVGIATQPAELFCRFGLDIRRRSPFPSTAVFGMTDGYAGYCPTLAAIAGGGYSAEPFYWTRLAPEAGDRIVDTASRLLREVRGT